ncbi:hypothetical protein [Jannaschia seohaensis]|uniref:Uncharacterized protein n=1 Tax=Jannaschia seohaensis TaxID=475081 RepID=A0A2Y9B531_9RHOB|nr:hypothetical protein [Jannaschia seohaensis]PWJ11189.1 hypothetical protein BCF38_12033 [Jannaschia seohaensis]SSA51490.1 hypothetical protein SAMN05421539_12033 [Jannaschia seohaensis]
MSGDTSIAFATLPEGWAPGDRIVIAGTGFEGHKQDNDIRGIRWQERPVLGAG